jgi:hypothetical protein
MFCPVFSLRLASNEEFLMASYYPINELYGNMAAIFKPPDRLCIVISSSGNVTAAKASSARTGCTTCK